MKSIFVYGIAFQQSIKIGLLENISKEMNTKEFKKEKVKAKIRFKKNAYNLELTKINTNKKS